MKKTFYIIFSAILGIVSSSMVIALAERWIINHALSLEVQPDAYFYIYDYGYVPQYFSIGIMALGFVLGFLLGRKWWKIVYIEKRHWRKKLRVRKG
jgi:hypothetical protein